VLTYGIPEFRLPKAIVREEVEALRKAGVVFETNQLIGATTTVDELFQSGFDAVFIGTGAGLPHFMNIPGESLIGVYSANEFLIRVNLMRAYDFPNFDTPIIPCKDKIVAVIGGGNTALDSARVALRLGAKEVHVIYRRSEEDMPARQEEYEHAKEEGIQFHFLCVPTRFNGNEAGWLTGATLQKMKQGELDASGRRSPVPIEGSEFDMPLEVAIVAVGNGSNPIIQRTTPDLAFNKRGNLIVEEQSMAANRPGVYGGGDIVTGGATVIRAMGSGRKAAAAIDQYLKQKKN
jgi:glutamate synthase (NADPH) small chain